MIKKSYEFIFPSEATTWIVYFPAEVVAVGEIVYVLIPSNLMKFNAGVWVKITLWPSGSVVLIEQVLVSPRYTFIYGRGVPEN
jgi:hypothetical protein